MNLEISVSHFPEKTGKFYFLKFILNRSIQKESFLADSAVASERLQLRLNRHGTQDVV